MVLCATQRYAPFQGLRAALIDELRNIGRTDKTHGFNSLMITDALNNIFSAIDDVENTIRLMYETVLALTPKTNLSYL